MQAKYEGVLKFTLPQRPSFSLSSPRLGMDNQAFRSSRDSNLSTEPSSPYHDDIQASLGDAKIPPDPENKTYDNELIEIEKENEVEPVLRDLEDKKNKSLGLQYKETDGISVTISPVPLLDALQGKNHLSGPVVPPRRKSRDGSTERMKERRVSLEKQITPEIRCNKRDLYHRPDVPTHPSQDLKCYADQSTGPSRTSRSVQAWPPPPYRLRVLPRRMAHSSGWRPALGLAGRWAFSQVGLGTLMLLWALAGAAAFRYTEGPREDKASSEMVSEQKFLVNGLMSELMQSDRDESKWRDTIEKYLSRHEGALSGGGGASTNPVQGRVWSLPGCVLFAVSLITTLGFGAPVPRTPEGRAVAVVFAAVGIPLHLLLVFNLGMVIAVKLQTFANRNNKTEEDDYEDDKEDIPKNEDRLSEITRRNNGLTIKHRRSGSEPIGRQAITNITREANFTIDSKDNFFQITEIDVGLQGTDKKGINNFIPKSRKNHESRYNICTFKSLQKLDKADRKIFKDIGSEPNTIPIWLKWLPFVGIAIYYTIGVLVFGFGRYQPFLDSLMFPLDFTVAGGVAMTSGHIRVLYAVYLEGAVVLTATTVSILQVSATQGLTDLGIKFGLVTNSR